MYLPTITTTLFLALAQCLVFTTAAPLLNTKSLARTTLHTRQVEAYFNAGDSGSTYTPGTAVQGTNSFRDEDGIYHPIDTRSENDDQINTQIKRNLSAAGSSAVRTSEASEPLWIRARAVLRAVLKQHDSLKRNVDDTQRSQAITEREEGVQVSADTTLPDGVLEKLDRGEKIYF